MTHFDDYCVTTGNSLKKVFREKSAAGIAGEENLAFISAAKNEYESFQVIVSPADGKSLKDVGVKVSELVNTEGKSVIPEEEIEVFRIGYVQAKYPGDHENNSGWWPDPLLPITLFDVAADQVQTVWVTIHVPKNVPAGEYSGVVIINPGNAQDSEVKIKLRVWDFTLPDRTSLSTVFGFTTLDTMSRFYDFYPGTEHEHSQIISKYLDFIAAHRINTLFYGSLTVRDPRCISIKKGADGRFCYDFSRVDPYLKLLVEKGMRFNIFAPIFWNKTENMFLMNPLLAQFAHIGDRVFESTDFCKVVADLLVNYVDHLKQKDWLHHAFAYVWDEPPASRYDHMRKMCDLVQKVAPELKRLTVANHAPGPLEGYSDIWCPNLGGIPGEGKGIYEKERAFYTRRQQAGDEIWWYIACQPHPYPNFFLDYPAIDCRIPFWITWRYGLDGLAYWNLNVWHYDLPGMSHGKNFRVPESKRWPEAEWNPSWTCGAKCDVAPCQGSGQLIYPGPDGPISSLRLEVIRDGIEDYEYLRLLEERTAEVVKKRASVERDTLVRRSDRLLTAARRASCNTRDYERNPAKLLSLRDSAGEQIEALTRAF